MKGTAPRRANPAADRAEAEALSADAKQRAENLMIVDLIRNDLARVCETGSIAVPELFVVETYPTLHQLVSRVSGRGVSCSQPLLAKRPSRRYGSGAMLSS